MYNTFEKFDLSGKTAFVTGGGTGMGYFMARGISALGAKVTIGARREGILKVAAEQLSDETGNQVNYATIDLADRENMLLSAQKISSDLGGIDIFVGNAAIDGFNPIDTMPDELVDNLLMINVAANISLARLFLPHMRSKKWGRFIFSSSITERLVSAQEGMAAYAASKSALSAIARSIAVEAGHDGITSNSLVIGAVMTDMLESSLHSVDETMRSQLVNSVISQNALGRFAKPDEVEGIVQLLASDAGSYITGASIPVEGGWSVTLKANMPQD